MVLNKLPESKQNFIFLDYLNGLYKEYEKRELQVNGTELRGVLDKVNFHESFERLEKFGLIHYKKGGCTFGDVELLDPFFEEVKKVEKIKSQTKEHSLWEIKIANIYNTIVNDSMGVIVGNHNSQEININNEFNEIYALVDSKNLKNKYEIKENIKKIENELCKENPHRITIQKSIGFLKSNASWIVPIIMEIIKKSFQ